MKMQRITPFLWFDGKSHEAARLYTSIFKNSRIQSVTPKSAIFILDGLQFYAFDGGPHFKFNEAFSLFVSCRTQREINYLWEKLSAGGTKSQCGWLKDKFGVSWQIVPSILGDLLNDPDPAKSHRVLQAMLKMRRLVISALKNAAKSPGRKSGK